jgi:hypothetical protein
MTATHTKWFYARFVFTVRTFESMSAPELVPALAPEAEE